MGMFPPRSAGQISIRSQAQIVNVLQLDERQRLPPVLRVMARQTTRRPQRRQPQHRLRQVYRPSRVSEAKLAWRLGREPSGELR